MLVVTFVAIACGIYAPLIYLFIRRGEKVRERARWEEGRRIRALLEWELDRAVDVYGIDTKKILAAIKKRRKGRC